MVRQANLRLLLLLTLSASSVGCASLKSRYAMDNEVYAEKYAEGVPKSDVVGKLKQANDARWVEGHTGGYLGGGVMVAPDTGSWMGAISKGREEYPYSWVSNRIAFEGIASTSQPEFLYGGIDLGIRAQTPSRIAPFVGAGGSVGFSAIDILASALEVEDDDDDWSVMAAAYPEVGVHFWVNGRYRLTFFGRYMITTSGRDHDGWLIGGQLATF